MKYIALVAPATVLFHSAGAQAAVDSPRILAPASAWTLDFADERCSLIREFGDGEDKVRLQIDSYGPRPGYRVMISGDLVPGSDANRLTDFRVGYSPDTRQRERFGPTMVGKFMDENAVSFVRAFLPDSPTADQADRLGSEFERSVTHMTLEFRLGKPFQLDTGSMAAPFAAMHRCVDNLIASWGIDPDEYRTLSRPVQVGELPESWNRIELAAQNSHPSPSERRDRRMAQSVTSPRAGDITPVRVMIDATGQPTACVVQAAFASEAYTQSVCGVLTDHRYQPALNADGEPVASFIQANTG